MSLLVVLALSIGVHADQGPASSTRAGRGRGGGRPRTFSYFIDQGSDVTGFKPGDRELATWAILDWERHAGGAIHFVPAAEDVSRIRIKWISPQPGQYGETKPTRIGNRFVSMVFIRPDTASLSPSIADAARLDPLLRDVVVYLTCLHEVGHAIGLSHTSDDRDIMYSFEFGGDVGAYFSRYRDQVKIRTAIPMNTGLSAHDVERLRGTYQTR